MTCQVDLDHQDDTELGNYQEGQAVQAGNPLGTSSVDYTSLVAESIETEFNTFQKLKVVLLFTQEPITESVQ